MNGPYDPRPPHFGPGGGPPATGPSKGAPSPFGAPGGPGHGGSGPAGPGGPAYGVPPPRGTLPRKSNVPLIAGGCGVLALLSCCCFGGIFGYMYMERRQAEGLALADLAQREAEARQAEELRRRGGGGLGPQLGGPGRIAIEAVVDTATFARRSRVRAGETCTFDVEHVPTPDGQGYWCHTEASCGGTTLYGSARNGFFTCTFATSPPSVTGLDNGTTSEDSDPTFAIDSAGRTLRIADDASGALGAFDVRATIRSVRVVP